MKQLRVGIIGQGRSGADIHAKYLVTDPDYFKIVAVADPIASRLEHAKKAYGYDSECLLTTDYRDLLKIKDLDLVVNASQSHLHAPISLEFLRAGFNVLCEKPMARTVAEVDAMAAAAKKAGRTLAVFQQSRFAPYFTQVKKVVDSGVLGRLVQVQIHFSGYARRWDWQMIDRLNAGGLRNTGPHPLDQALRFLDFKGMPEVVCHLDLANSFGDADDFAKVLLKAPGRPLVEVEVSSCNAYSGFTYLVQGTRGGLKGSMKEIEWKYFDEKEAPKRQLCEKPISTPEGGPAYCSETLPWKEEKWTVPAEDADLFKAISSRYYRMLHRTLTEGAPLEVTVEQVRQQVAVTEECHRQAALRRGNKPVFALPARTAAKAKPKKAKKAAAKKAKKKKR
ncbi:MAG: Gfo/Idh/MocA family oxidoreductase [Spirochaetes bacterium]|nr:Gfo/Idh/MocA family oxidoreductase [Spirochaetota bacterium]